MLFKKFCIILDVLGISEKLIPFHNKQFSFKHLKFQHV